MLTYKVLNVTSNEVTLGTPDGKTMNCSISEFGFPVKKGMLLEMYKSDKGKRFFSEHEVRTTATTGKPMVQPSQVPVVRTPRNMGLALFLAFVAGPLGLLYASVRDALVLILINIAAGGFLLFMTMGSIAGHTASRMSNQAGGGDGPAGVFAMLLVLLPVVTWVTSLVLAYKDVKSYNSGGSGHTL